MKEPQHFYSGTDLPELPASTAAPSQTEPCGPACELSNAQRRRPSWTPHLTQGGTTQQSCENAFYYLDSSSWMTCSPEPTQSAKASPPYQQACVLHTNNSTPWRRPNPTPSQTFSKSPQPLLVTPTMSSVRNSFHFATPASRRPLDANARPSRPSSELVPAMV